MDLDSSKIVSGIIGIVGEDYVSDKLHERRLYDHDLAPLPTEVGIMFKTIPDAVVIPKSTEEVGQVVRFCYENTIPVIPRGSSSWGYGGTIPTQGGLVIESVRLNTIEISESDKIARVGAGVRWKMLLTKLETHGFTFPVYPSSAPSGTVGGWLATGGFGLGSLKYGHVKNHVLELTVVTPSGETRILSSSDEDFDIYFDSEGTLGFITEAKISIIPKPESIRPVLVGFKDYATVRKVIGDSVSENSIPFLIEIQDSEYLQLKRSIGIHQPESPILCLFVYEGPSDEVESSMNALHTILVKNKGIVYSDEEAWTDWEERFNSMNIKRAGPTLLAGELTFPVSSIKEVLEGLRRIKKKHSLQLGVKAFMVSSETVLILPMFLADERKRWKYMSLLPVVNEITEVGLKWKGGPYGIGIWNSFFLKKHHGIEKTRQINEMKRKHDPKGIMNPGKLYNVKMRYGIPLPGFLFRFATSFLWILRYF